MKTTQFRPNQRVYWTFEDVDNWKQQLGTIVGPGEANGSWRVRLENGTTVVASEKDLVIVKEQDY